MNSSRATFAALCSASLIGACVYQPSLNELPSSDHAGHLTPHAAGTWFVPCGSAAADSAWVTFTDGAVGQRDSLTRAGGLVNGTRYFVRLRAAVTQGGEIGPRGPGAPAYLVREILVVRPPSSSDCAP
jgi:hypothetical protein